MTNDSVLIEQLGADDATLDYQIARVHQGHSEHREHVVPKLVALHRLAQLDICAWETQVTRLWPTKALELIDNREQAGGQSVNGLMVNVGGQNALDRLCGMFVTADESSETDVDRMVAIPVHLNLLFMGNRVGRAIASVEAMVRSLQHTPPSRRAIFRIKRVGVDTQEMYDAHCLSQLTDHARHGIAIGSFPHLDFHVTRPNAPSVVSNLQLLLATQSCDADRSSDRDLSAIVSSVRLAPQALCAQHEILSMLISAAGNSATVREVTAYISRLNEEDDTDVNACIAIAKRLAFSLFSRASRHRIRHLVLENGVSSPIALQSMSAILQAEDPVVAMFPELADSVDERRAERLAASRFLLFDPESARLGESVPVLDNHPHCGLRVLSYTPRWWSVVLPAWGQAWVPCADATVTTVDPSTTETSSRHWIPEMSLMMPTTEEMTQTLAWLAWVGTGVTLAWLAWVGTGVTALTVSGNNSAPTVVTLDWADATRAFPNVETLRVDHVQVDSLHVLLDLPPWHLRSLRLSNVSVIQPGSGLTALLYALADEDHPLATTLTTLDICTTRSTAPQVDVVAAALRMLSTNRLLQSFTLSVEKHNDDEVDYTAMRAAFAAQHGAPIRRRHLREKLALLSVALRCHGGNLARLDSGIFVDVFGLAGLCHHRTVELVLRGR